MMKQGMKLIATLSLLIALLVGTFSIRSLADTKNAVKEDYVFAYDENMSNCQWRVIVDTTIEGKQQSKESNHIADSESGESDPADATTDSAESDEAKQDAESNGVELAKSEPVANEEKPEPAQEGSIQDSDIPLSAGLDTNGDGEIDIYTDIENPENGDIVTLSTPLSKIPNDFGLLCQWFVDRGDGRGFTPIEDANGKTYSYTYSDTFARHRFRVELSVPHTDGE